MIVMRRHWRPPRWLPWGFREAPWCLESSFDPTRDDIGKTEDGSFNVMTAGESWVEDGLENSIHISKNKKKTRDFLLPRRRFLRLEIYSIEGHFWFVTSRGPNWGQVSNGLGIINGKSPLQGSNRVRNPPRWEGQERDVKSEMPAEFVITSLTQKPEPRGRFRFCSDKICFWSIFVLVLFAFSATKYFLQFTRQKF